MGKTSEQGGPKMSSPLAESMEYFGVGDTAAALILSTGCRPNFLKIDRNWNKGKMIENKKCCI